MQKILKLLFVFSIGIKGFLFATLPNLEPLAHQLSQSSVEIFIANKKDIYGAGSGFFISKDGYIVTNAHVIDRAKHIFVITCDKKLHLAKCIGEDEETDLAVLKIEGQFKPLTFAQQNDIQKNMYVFNVSAPCSLTRTFSYGKIDDVPVYFVRNKDQLHEYILASIPTNYGSSGSALVDSNAKIVGVISAIGVLSSDSGAKDNNKKSCVFARTFAISSSLAQRVIDHLIKFGEVQKSTLNIEFSRFSERPIVRKVQENGPADRAGIRSGDIITTINNQDVCKIGHFRIIEAFLPRNKTVIIKVTRNQEELVFRIVPDLVK